MAKQPDTRPFIQLKFIVDNQEYTDSFLIDTGSEVTIVRDDFVNNKPAKEKVIVQGVSGHSAEMRKEWVTFKIYDLDYTIQVLVGKVPHGVLGIQELRLLYGEWLPLKRLKCFETKILSQVKIDPVKLPHTPPVFTKQYPIKGGHEEISATIKEMLEKDIIEKASSFKYNSPVWPVMKPNGKWRLTVDYRNINKVTPSMPGTLPDVESIYAQIRNFSPTCFCAIDLSDMFFAIPLDIKSRELTTFTWESVQYRFKRLPQGYKNSPIIAHVTLQETLKDFQDKGTTKLWSYVDDILIAGKDMTELNKVKDEVVTLLKSKGWSINPDKIQGPATSVKYLGVVWTTEGPKVPDAVINKILALQSPKTKTEAQQVMGILGYWRLHIPYLQMILAPIHRVCRKAADFVWGPEQKKSLELAKEYVQTYTQLYVPQPGEEIIIDIIYANDFGNWGIYTKSNSQTKPVGFYSKRFPFSENKYSFFEKTVWTAYTAVQSLGFVLTNRVVTLRTQIPILDWVRTREEDFRGLPMEQKVLKWKWYLLTIINDATVSGNNKTLRLSELVFAQPMVEVPVEVKQPKTQPIGKWGAVASHKNAWFTDGSSKVVGNVTKWKAVAYRPSDKKILVKEGSDASAQLAELCAVKLAVEQSIHEKKKYIHIFSDSWAVCNGIAIWSAKWKESDYKINGKDVWGIHIWKFLAEAPIHVKIAHVDAHTGRTDEISKFNDVADKLSKFDSEGLKLVNKAPWKILDRTDTKIRLKRDPNWHIKLPELNADISEDEIRQLHKELGHIGTHGMFQWFQGRNIKVTWGACKHAISGCELCASSVQRFRRDPPHNRPSPRGFNEKVQIDYIGPLQNGKYVCTMVDCSTGLGHACASRHADQSSTMKTIWSWCAAYGCPWNVTSDQGSHFTGRNVQKLADVLGINWDFHLAYNPQAAGNIERFNGLLKTKLWQIGQDVPFDKAILIAVFELNSRQRLHRRSPFEETFQKDIDVQADGDPNPDNIRPYKVWIRNRKDNSVIKGEIVSHGQGNTLWVSTGKGDLRLVKSQDVVTR